jgi:hypothetical protein
MKFMRDMTHQIRHPRGSSPCAPPGDEESVGGGVGWIQSRGRFNDDETGPDTVNFRSAVHSYPAPDQGGAMFPHETLGDDGA